MQNSNSKDLAVTNAGEQSQNNDFEVLVDPKEFGIDTMEDKRVPITDIFAFYQKEYNEIVNAPEITPELTVQAWELRKKVSKIRIGIGKIHKLKKEYWLTGGREVDAWKNENSEIVEQKENRLTAIESHFRIIEQQKKAEILEQRLKQLKELQIEGVAVVNLHSMDQEVWESFLAGAKLKAEEKKEQERIAEEERIQKVQQENESREKMRIENERLNKEAQDREDKLDAERKKQAQILAKQKAESDAKLKAEREANAKLQAELKAKQDAEAKAKAEEEAKIEAEAKMKDKDKVSSLVVDLTVLKTKYWFSSAKNKKMYLEVQTLLDKVIGHIQK